VFVTNGVVEMNVTCVYLTDNDWAGFALYTKDTYNASQLSPIDFEIDRTKMEYVMSGGSSTKERVGVWIKDSTTNFVFFSELGSWDTIAGGWQYHRVIGQAGDNVITALTDGGGVYMAAFNAANYLDQKNHHMKAVANGSTVKFYLDGIFGAEVSFPFAQGIRFGFGSYANVGNAVGTTTRGFFDNAVIHNYPALPAELGPLTVSQSGGKITVTWASGTLQTAPSVTGPWSDKSTASPLTETMPDTAKFYRTVTK
jgi:hypothetical protein